MLIGFSDTETTGLVPGDHRLIETYVGIYDADTREKVDEQLLRIHPMRTIQPAAQAVHHISIEDLEGCPVWEHVAGSFRDFIEQVDLIVGHNWDGFDGPFIKYELERLGLPDLTKPTFDTMLRGRFATPMGTVPNLGALCWACGVPYDESKAHAADYDCDVMAQAFFAGLDWGWFNIEGASETAIAA